MVRARQIVISICALMAALVMGAPAGAGPPNPDEQWWLEMINRFRASPVNELDLLTNYTEPGGSAWDFPRSDNADVAGALNFFNTRADILRQQFNALQPAPPLAWSVDLHDSASYYNGVIIDNDRQSHFLDPLTLTERITRNSDYDFTGGGRASENIFAFTRSVEHGHTAFVVDWGNCPACIYGIQVPPGHRDTLIDDRFREIGIAITPESNPATNVGPNVATHHVAVDNLDGPFLTGVAFHDRDGNDFYSPSNEAIGGLSIDVFPAGAYTSSAAIEGASPIATTTTFASGGYSLELPVGTYDVRFAGTGVDQVFRDVDFTSGTNVKLDLIDPVLIGDVNGDGTVNNLDITGFILALNIGGSVNDPANLAAFDLQVSGGNFGAADVDMSLLVNNLDISPFIAGLDMASSGSGSLSAVPEPGTMALIVGCGLACWRRQGHGRMAGS